MVVSSLSSSEGVRLIFMDVFCMSSIMMSQYFSRTKNRMYSLSHSYRIKKFTKISSNMTSKTCHVISFFFFCNFRMSDPFFLHFVAETSFLYWNTVLFRSLMCLLDDLVYFLKSFQCLMSQIHVFSWHKEIWSSLNFTFKILWK